MSKQQEILNLYNQQLEDLTTTKAETKKYLLSIAQDDNVKQFINRFFELKDDATFSDTRPLLFPVERVEKVQYQKKFLSNDELSFEVEGEKFQFEIPHRSKYFSNQKEQLKLFRVMMEQ